MKNLEKRELIYASIVLLSFFLPWVSWGLISFKGYQMPGMISDYSNLDDILKSLTRPDSQGQTLLAYSIYLIPVLTITSLIKNIRQENSKAPLNFLVLYVILSTIYSSSIYGLALLSSADIGIYIIVIATIIYTASLYNDKKKNITRENTQDFRIDKFRTY